MKTHHFIIKEDSNLYVIPEMPERHDHYHGDVFMSASFDRALDRAKESAILVENKDDVFLHIYFKDAGRIYPLECQIEVKERWSPFKSCCRSAEECYCKVALITFSVPKPSEEMNEGPTFRERRNGATKKANWLKYCLVLGWPKESLDALSEVWDKFKDEAGNLKPSEEQVERQSSSSVTSPELSEDFFKTAKDLTDIIERQFATYSTDLTKKLARNAAEAVIGYFNKRYEGGYTEGWNDAVKFLDQPSDKDQSSPAHTDNQEELDLLIKKADDMREAFEKLLKGLATDGTAIEGFVDAWNAQMEYLNQKINFTHHQKTKVVPMEESKNSDPVK